MTFGGSRARTWRVTVPGTTPSQESTDVVKVSRGRRGCCRPRSRFQAAHEACGAPPSRSRGQARVSRSAHRATKVAASLGVRSTRIDRREVGARVRSSRRDDRTDGLLHQGSTTGRDRRRARRRACQRPAGDRRVVSVLWVEGRPTRRRLSGSDRRDRRRVGTKARGHDRRYVPFSVTWARMWPFIAAWTVLSEGVPPMKSGRSSAYSVNR